jgi:hypothetical protein
MLNNIGLVCSRWKDAVHYSAVKLLMSCIKAGQLEEKQIERFGWRTSAAWDHDNEKAPALTWPSASLEKVQSWLRGSLGSV